MNKEIKLDSTSRELILSVEGINYGTAINS
jgi:hypothetical protein